MASSSPPASPSGNRQLLPVSDGQSSLSNVVYELSQQVQAAMENMLKMITEIDQSSSGIIEEIEKCKYSAFERKKSLEEGKERFQKAAFSVLDMLNNNTESN
ncbi:uncharacterized protein LOC111918735 [Lactuca sativa]|uniref:uncharacterized protein LOC111918735 n=1 Tax=Lactuca sativa TaxID=4236 RepID=UPI000CC7C97F|nr:uncharacterized protein LOC111918735 [Lactuca sativa]